MKLFKLKATEQDFPVVMFILLYIMVLTFESVDEILSVIIQREATKQYDSVEGDHYYIQTRHKDLFSHYNLILRKL